MTESDYCIINLREYLNGNIYSTSEENGIKAVLSDFLCDRNPDIQKFIRDKAIEFAKRDQTVTYLVFDDESHLISYFALSVKAVEIDAEGLSETVKRKISYVGLLDEYRGVYTAPAYLIAQLGKNYFNGLHDRITGDELLSLALKQVIRIQYMAGGKIVFLETIGEEKLLSFYERNGFRPFTCKPLSRTTKKSNELIQMFRII